MSERYVVFALPENSAIADLSIIGPWHTYEGAEAFLRPFQAKRGYLSCIVVPLLSAKEARAEWEPGEGEGG